ncbi:hypothetical protein C0Q70_16374 [Pomacea canaliculata]|uniref:Uncharacterized protein n=1 Tax=Pomacea canaliculata TaxID=400727 RepID=A0A2T7NPL9_POMCA|nr:hypothetical protein C0Q70_16374 [Pomacea canaliculata]
MFTKVNICAESREKNLETGNNVNDYLNILLHTDEWQVPIEYGEVSMSSGDPHDNTADNAGVRVKSEPDSQKPGGCQRLQKSVSAYELRRGVVCRASPAKPPAHAVAPLSRSESEAGGEPPPERLHPQLGPRYPEYSTSASDANGLEDGSSCLPAHSLQRTTQVNGSGGVAASWLHRPLRLYGWGRRRYLRQADPPRGRHAGQQGEQIGSWWPVEGGGGGGGGSSAGGARRHGARSSQHQ